MFEDIHSTCCRLYAFLCIKFSVIGLSAGSIACSGNIWIRYVFGNIFRWMGRQQGHGEPHVHVKICKSLLLADDTTCAGVQERTE